ncbi:MAG: ribosomal RNA small subunit methyltransferase A [Deltaproteobacteria bacterium]|nr:ribosomal RNA small subunit methyltransferase A [Deltaproteobacteria bacterium]
MGLVASKNLGQHFLLNPTTIDQIVKKAGVKATEQVLEIGPGPGVLTRRLAETARRVIAVEKDERFAALLTKELETYKNLTIVGGDILDCSMEKLLGEGKWKVVANLPYNIATEVIFHLLKTDFLFSAFYLMVQKEVAERLVALPGSRSYGLLSIFSQILCQNRIIMKLPPGAFTPPPKVSSAIVEFLIHEEPRFPIHHLPTFELVVQAAFSQRRKMIHNCLKSGLPDHPWDQMERAMRAADISPNQRAEEISIEKYVELANNLFESQGSLA